MSDANAIERLTILRAFVAAQDRIAGIAAAISDAATDTEAMDRVGALLNCNPTAARAVCSMSILRLASRESRANLNDELEALERHLSP